MSCWIFLMVFFLSSCGIIFDDLTQVKKAVDLGNYEQAIDMMSRYQSMNSKKYNSNLHVIYADHILQNLDLSKAERYSQAKLLLKKALVLDSTNKKARTFYVMLTKLDGHE